MPQNIETPPKDQANHVRAYVLWSLANDLGFLLRHCVIKVSKASVSLILVGHDPV